MKIHWHRTYTQLWCETRPTNYMGDQTVFPNHTVQYKTQGLENMMCWLQIVYTSHKQKITHFFGSVGWDSIPQLLHMIWSQVLLTFDISITRTPGS